MILWGLQKTGTVIVYFAIESSDGGRKNCTVADWLADSFLFECVNCPLSISYMKNFLFWIRSTEILTLWGFLLGRLESIWCLSITVFRYMLGVQHSLEGTWKDQNSLQVDLSSDRFTSTKVPDQCCIELEIGAILYQRESLKFVVDVTQWWKYEDTALNFRYVYSEVGHSYIPIALFAYC